ncbi:MAG: hypothetical protein OIF40_14385 [Mangrovicoccus sp.]|nr:hypothetical protein [Mangrovicoccus sp.]
MMARRVFSITGAVVTSLLAGAAAACGFHGYTPAPTLTDRLLGSEHVVLARPAADNPYLFEVTETLVGPDVPVVIPFLVDTPSRARLAHEPQSAVLFARDGGYGPFERVAFADPTLRPIIDEVITKLPDWEMGDDAERFQFFADLQNHPDPGIQRLALLELDRADYGILRQLSLAPLQPQALTPVDGAVLPAPQGVVAGAIGSDLDLVPIRVLLLGLSGAPEAGPILNDGFAQAAKTGSVWLGAYAAALIELEGAAVAESFLALLLDPSTKADARESLLDAIALHAVLREEAERQILLDHVIQALAQDPSLAIPVARQFGARSDGALATQVRAAMASVTLTQPVDAITVAQYLALGAPQTLGE